MNLRQIGAMRSVGEYSIKFYILVKLLIFGVLNLILQVGKKIGTGEGQVLGI